MPVPCLGPMSLVYAVAMDAVLATMTGLDSGQLCFRTAEERGLGDYDMDAIDGKLTVILDFVVPHPCGRTIAGNQCIQEFMDSKVDVRPKADQTLYTSCVDRCPVYALSLNDDDPSYVDMALFGTILCFQKICQEKAMGFILN